MQRKKRKENQRQIIILQKVCLLVFFIIGIDQLSKFLICRILSETQTIPVIGNIFSLTLVFNTGAAFGVLRGQNLFFIIVTLCVLAVMIIFMIRTNFLLLRLHDRIWNIGLSLILGGAIGNLIDRIAYGYVIDFLDFKVWPVFNIADSMISAGAVIIGINLLKDKK